MENNRSKPIVLAILDGWGMSPSWGGNAISMNSPKNMNELWRDYPHAILQSFRQVAGLYKMVGNSEIGHSSIAAGKIVFQDLERISQSVVDKSFFQNQALLTAIKNCQSYNSSLHLLGMVSDGGIHSHIDHLIALLQLAKLQNLPKVYIHIITDGLDATETSALDFILKLESEIARIGVGQIVSIFGRSYAMDRDNDWAKTAKVLATLVNGRGNVATSARSAVVSAYKSGCSDSEIPPTIIKTNGHYLGKVSYNDSLVFFNFRPDRSRQLTLALLGLHSFGSRLRPPENLKVVTFTNYYLPAGQDQRVLVAFPSEKIDQTLGKIISQQGMKQLRIAESEKAPHISYFFNCGFDQLLPGEERVIINSDKHELFVTHPEMKAHEIKEKVVEAIANKSYDFILINFANVDSLAHTGDLFATAKAVEVVDDCVGEIAKATLATGGTLIITADHGNGEQMVSTEGIGDRETFHSKSPVPFIFVRSDLKNKGLNKASFDILSAMLSSKKSLADIAPTILSLYDIEKPASMTGNSLLSDIIVDTGGESGE